jgi:hypothetical protein
LENLKSHIFLVPHQDFALDPLGGPCAAPKTLGGSFQDFQENSLSSMLVLNDNRSFTKFDLEL